MSDITTSPGDVEGDEAPEEHHHGHISDWGLIQVAIVLAAVTAVEVAWSYAPWPDSGGIWTVIEVGGLLCMMGFKFFVVASFFMHLKWDHKLLTGVFYFGLFLAILVYLAVLFAFEFFSKSSPPYVN